MVVILVQAANEHLLFAPPHLAFDVVVFPAVAGFQSQSAIAPELSLGAKPMRGLDHSHRQSRANRPQGGELPQFGSDGMLATLRQQFAPGLLAQGLRSEERRVGKEGRAGWAPERGEERGEMDGGR